MRDLIACYECRAYYLANRGALVKVSAEVGREFQVPRGVALRIYLEGFHEADHDEDYAYREDDR